jgi:hypothetical protein
MYFNKLGTQQNITKIVMTSIEIPDPSEFRAELEDIVWPPITNYLIIAVGVTVIMFVLSKLGG